MGPAPIKSKKKSRALSQRPKPAIGAAVAGEQTAEDCLLVGVIAEGAPPSDHNDPTNWMFRRLQLSAREASKRHPSSIRVQFIIMLTGPLVRPDFAGVQTGSFIQARKQLNVVIAVPDPLEVPLVQFLAAAIEEGWGLAQQYLRQKGLGDLIKPLEQAIGDVLQELRQEEQALDLNDFPELVEAEFRWLIDHHGLSVAHASRIEPLSSTVVLSNPTSHVRVGWGLEDPKHLAVDLGSLAGRGAVEAYVAGERYPLWLLAWVRSSDKAYALSLTKLGGGSRADVQAGLRHNSWAMQTYAADVLSGDFSVFELLDTAHNAVVTANAEHRAWPAARSLKAGEG